MRLRNIDRESKKKGKGFFVNMGTTRIIYVRVDISKNKLLRI